MRRIRDHQGRPARRERGLPCRAGRSEDRTKQAGGLGTRVSGPGQGRARGRGARASARTSATVAEGGTFTPRDWAADHHRYDPSRHACRRIESQQVVARLHPRAINSAAPSVCPAANTPHEQPSAGADLRRMRPRLLAPLMLDPRSHSPDLHERCLLVLHRRTGPRFDEFRDFRGPITPHGRGRRNAEEIRIRGAPPWGTEVSYYIGY